MKSLLSNGSTLISSGRPRGANRPQAVWGDHGIDTANPGEIECASGAHYWQVTQMLLDGVTWNYIYGSPRDATAQAAADHWLSFENFGAIKFPCVGEKFNFVIRQTLIAKLNSDELTIFVATH